MQGLGDGLGRVAVCMGLVVLAASLVAVSDAGAQDDSQPPRSSFSDVEGHWAADHIAALEDLGVFEGTECGEAMLCPDSPLKRETMAVWLVRVLDGSEPEPVEGTRFADVDGSHRWAAPIERFAELGVTTGCGDGTNYCPDATVSRAEMASFLVRAFELPAAEPAGFGDIAGDFHEDNINRVAAAGITTGCGDGTNYCPDGTVSRAEMAVFIDRALSYVDSLESGLARAAAMEIFSVVYSSASPFSAVAPHLEDAAALEAVHAQFAAYGANIGGVEITATDATAAADRTDRVIVTFEVRVAGVSIPITGRNTSSVWLVDGTWIISRGAFCNAMAQLEITCPPVGEQTVESGWVEPYAGYVPPVHPDTPPLQGKLTSDPSSWQARPADEPRATGDDRRMVAAWIAWAGPTGHTQWMLFNMKWALDYLGADPQCVINEYTDRVAAARRAAISAPGAAEPYKLRDLHAWHNCATVIDPYQVGVELPAGRDNDVGLRLSDTPGITLAERCRAVLPPDVQLEKSWYQQRGPRRRTDLGVRPRRGTSSNPGTPDATPGQPGTPPIWPSSPIGRAASFPSVLLRPDWRRIWMEHYRDLPEHYTMPTCYMSGRFDRLDGSAYEWHVYRFAYQYSDHGASRHRSHRGS